MLSHRFQEASFPSCFLCLQNDKMSRMSGPDMATVCQWQSTGRASSRAETLCRTRLREQGGESGCQQHHRQMEGNGSSQTVVSGSFTRGMWFQRKEYCPLLNRWFQQERNLRGKFQTSLECTTKISDLVIRVEACVCVHVRVCLNALVNVFVGLTF